MRTLRHLAGYAILLAAAFAAHGQNLTTLSQLWQQTLTAIQRGDKQQAQSKFDAFNSAARSYVAANGRSWQVEYLAGSLDCLFPDKKAIGAEFLRDILQNNRALNESGNEELQRQLTACESKDRSVPTASQMSLPQDLTETSTHYQMPGVRGDLKGGGKIIGGSESSAAVSPIPIADLRARMVDIHDPQRALANALARMPKGANGAVVGDFAVATTQGTAADASAIGNCLASYAAPLEAEFQINSPAWMVTAYAVPDESDVYGFARQLHGLKLPLGVIAYSVPEDMSLVAPAFDHQCGSMAHELVHLLIKRSFPDAPAWLEEGLASEVAVAAPTPSALRFGWSWRDETLRKDYGIYPTVAELLNAPWSAFNSDYRGDALGAEARQAMAAVWIRYLDAKGKLRSVYFGVRDQHLAADLSGFKSYQKTLEEQLHMPVAAIDHDFAQWFEAESSRHPAPHATYDGSTGGGSGEEINPAPELTTPCVAPAQNAQQGTRCGPPPAANGSGRSVPKQ